MFKLIKYDLMIVLLISFLLFFCGGSNLYAKKKLDNYLVYGFVSPGPDTWYKMDADGFEYGAKLVKRKVIVLNSDYDIGKEVANIDSLIAQGVDGIVFFTFNSTGAHVAAKKCKAAGIPLVLVGEPIDLKLDIVGYTDFDWRKMGTMYADHIAQKFPGENIAMITGIFEHVPVQMYRSTLEARVKKLGKNKIVAIRDGKYNPSVAVDQAQDLIESGLDFSILFVGNEEMAAAVIRMLKSRGKLNNPIRVISQNGAPYGVPLVKSGSLEYTLSSSPGWEGMIQFLMLEAYIKGVKREINQKLMLPVTEVNKSTINDKEKVIPWEPDLVWHKLTHKYYPEYDGLY